MTASIRYKFVKNATGAAITDPNAFPVTNDGDDKKVIFVKHVLAAGDIGNAAGQTGHTAGLILDVMPNNYNVLWIQGLSYRPTAAAGINQHKLIDNTAVAGPDTIRPVYEVYSDNTIRVVDSNYAVAAARLALGDIITVMIVVGPQKDSRDLMN